MMFLTKTRNKYAFAGLCCTLFSLLLLTLSGCDATSDPRPSFQPTGSWQGTIGTDQVRGSSLLIAPIIWRLLMRREILSVNMPA